MIARFMASGPGIAVTAMLFALGLTGLDQLVDGEPARLADVAVDLLDRAAMLGAMAAIAFLVSRVALLRREAEGLRSELDGVSAATHAWRRKSRRLLDGLNEAIAAQFGDWGLTAAEADIGGLMLKGLPLADIATLRRTSEATIRQQAQAIYRKSGMNNRSEFAAYFLEDLFDVAGAALPGLPRAEPSPLN